MIPIDRVADQKPYYSGKHKRHGANLQVIADAAGRLVWASPALAGAAHDLTAARAHGIIDALTSADVLTFADMGYQGACGGVRTRFRRRRFRPTLSRRQRAVNRAYAKIRARGERAIATLKTWKVLVKLRCCPCQRRPKIFHAPSTAHGEPRQSCRRSSPCTAPNPTATPTCPHVAAAALDPVQSFNRLAQLGRVRLRRWKVTIPITVRRTVMVSIRRMGCGELGGG